MRKDIFGWWFCLEELSVVIGGLVSFACMFIYAKKGFHCETGRISYQKSGTRSFLAYFPPIMSSSPSERDALLTKRSPPTTYQDVEALTDSPSTTVDESPQEERGAQQSGRIRAELKLFSALLVDSIPGKSAGCGIPQTH